VAHALQLTAPSSRRRWRPRNAQAGRPPGRPLLLHGVTGSGKTEVYLHAAEAALAAGRQALVLVPEINLTPQLEARFAERFPGRVSSRLHSGLTPAQRLRHWLLAHLGRADLVLGTRLAVFAPLPRLGLIVVDEEHDPSYKQQEGARYSARDLAVYRGHLERVPVILGSATPSLETWHALPARAGRYQRLALAQRMGGGALPRVRLVDMGVLPKAPGAGARAGAAAAGGLEERIARGEQSLLFLNRRGYAPVLHCTACGWKSGCPHCSAWRVFHKARPHAALPPLRLHRAGAARLPRLRQPRHRPVGRGTEKLEEQLAELLPGARIARIDADTTRGKGALESAAGQVHAGEVDVLVGTQMVTKGHDFRRITLVAAVNPDGALFSQRLPRARAAVCAADAGRRPRRARRRPGRAQRDVGADLAPAHPLYAALKPTTSPAFAASQLAEREAAGLPPFSPPGAAAGRGTHAEVAAGLPAAAAELADGCRAAEGVTVYPPVPPAVAARWPNVERMQMLVESPSRAALQRCWRHWLPALHALRAAATRGCCAGRWTWTRWRSDSRAVVVGSGMGAACVSAPRTVQALAIGLPPLVPSR
jgi:primosomal protein N' (replication factor Y)